MQNPLRRPRGEHSLRRGNRPPFEDAEGSRNNPSGPSKAIRGHVVAMMGEFVGTVMFLFFAFGATQIANNVTPPDEPSLDRLLYVDPDKISKDATMTMYLFNVY